MSNFILIALLTIFHSISEIECGIDNFQNFVSSSPRSHPLRSTWLLLLAWLRTTHYKTSNSYQQLDQSIHHLAEALALPRDDPDPDIAPHLFGLANSLYLRWSRSKKPEDIKSCIKYLQYFRGQRIQAHQRKAATSWLVLVLADSEPAESMSDIVVENIKEMTILCRELLNSDSSASPPILPFQALTNVITGGYGITGELQGNVIECLQEANTCFLSSPRLSFMLGDCLARRFSKAFSIIDYEEAMAILDKVIISSSDLPEDVQSDIQQKSLAAVAWSSYTRYYSSGKPEYLEEAVSRIRTYLSSIPLDHEDRPRFSRKLTDLTESRVRGYAIQLGSHKCPETFDFSTLSSLTTSLTESNSSLMSHKQWGRHDQALRAIALTAQISEDEDAIKYCRLLVASLRRGSSSSSSSSPGYNLTHIACITLGLILQRAFLSTHKVEYLEESIATLRDGLKIPGIAYHQQSLIGFLTISLSTRLLLPGPSAKMTWMKSCDYTPRW